MAFKPGDSVEISSKEKGFIGSYYVATILKPIPNNRYLVEYKTLVTDDEKAMLREVVHGSEIRPIPPQIPGGVSVSVSVSGSGFEFFDKVVDAYDNDGWWVGRITGLARIKPKEYYVYFDSTGDEIAYPFYRLRVHQDWMDGQWVLETH